MRHSFPHNIELQKKRNRMTLLLFVLCSAFAIWFTIVAFSNQQSALSNALFSALLLVVLGGLAYWVRKKFSLIIEIEMNNGELKITRYKQNTEIIFKEEIVALLYYEHKAKTKVLALQLNSNRLVLLEGNENLQRDLSAWTNLPITQVE